MSSPVLHLSSILRRKDGTDHIVPREEDGPDDIENAIPVCFECHAEIHSYNDKHPRGRKFLPEELRRHKEEWLRICRERPDALVAAPRDVDVGPLHALIDELELNATIAGQPGLDVHGCLFRDDQLRRAISAGSIAMLREDIKAAVLAAYVAMGAANRLIEAAWQHPKGGNDWAVGVNEASKRIREARPLVERAQAELLRFLSAEAV